MRISNLIVLLCSLGAAAAAVPAVPVRPPTPPDWFHIIPIDAHTYAISEPKYWQENVSYLLIGSRRALLFDTGPGIYSIRAAVASLTSLPVVVIPSHLHFDHVGDLEEFDDGMPHTPLTTKTIAAAFMTACGLIASQPIGYLFNGPDWVRYLPTATSGRQIFYRVFLWTFLPSIALTAMGAMWATLGDMSDPVAGLKPFIPSWLFVIYAFAVVGGAVASNIPVFYSSGLSLQSLGLGMTRWMATAVDVLVSTAIVIFILFVEDFTTALNDFVALFLVWVGPYGGVWMCDGVLRRWVYPTGAVHRSGVFPPLGAPDRRLIGWISLSAGMVVGILTMRSPLYDGPIAMMLGGMDLNWILGFFVGGGSYYALTASPLRRSSWEGVGS